MKTITAFWSLTLILLISCKQLDIAPVVTASTIDKPILIKNINVFNGIDSVLLKNQHIVIHNGIIQSINSESPDLLSQYFIIDGTGKTVMPGLIDSHVHITGSGAVPWKDFKPDIEYNLSAYLYAGITTVYDLGGMSKTVEDYANKVTTGKIIGPTVYHTHLPITVKNGHPIPLVKELLGWPMSSLANMISPTINDKSEASDVIEQYLKNDVDYIKIIMDQIPHGSSEMTFLQLQALVKAAHERNKKVFIHVGSPVNAIEAINSGGDVLAHGVWRGKLSEKQAEFIANSKIPIIYTLAPFLNVASIKKGTFKPTDLDRVLVPNEVLQPVSTDVEEELHEYPAMKSFFTEVDTNSANCTQNLRLLVEKNAVIAVGTDSNLPGTYAGSTLIQEIFLLQDAGLSNFQVLNAVTYQNSRLFQDNSTYGSVEKGKRADLIILNDNPLDHLESIKRPHLIISKGVVIDRVR